MKATVSLLAACVLVTSSCSPDDADAAEGRADFTRVTTTLETVESPGIEKVRTVDGIFFASQPDASGFEAAKRGGIKTVINLRHADEIELDEAEVVGSLGLTYLHLPWNGPEELTDEVFDRTREMLESAEKPVLLHCASANRVGAVWLPYRVLDGGWDVEDALEEARAIGLKTPEYEEKALDYIERQSR